MKRNEEIMVFGLLSLIIFLLLEGRLIRIIFGITGLIFLVYSLLTSIKIRIWRNNK